MKSKALLLSCLLLFSACENNSLGSTEKGAIAGTVIGAGLGAIIGHETGHTGAGVAIGSGFGALAGGLMGRQVEQTDKRLDQREQQLAEQERIIAENRRMIDELKSRGVDARQTDRGVVINLPDVLFEFDSAKLTPEARDTTREISTVINDLKDRKIAVEGHTDSVGSASYNERLSRDRAESVADSLIDRGLSRSSVRVRGYGEDRPVASNDTDSGRARNRRVEVIVEN